MKKLILLLAVMLLAGCKTQILMDGVKEEPTQSISITAGKAQKDATLSTGQPRFTERQFMNMTT